MRKVYQLKNDTELKDLKNILKSVILSRFEVPGSKRARDLGLTRLAKNIENDEKLKISIGLQIHLWWYPGGPQISKASKMIKMIRRA